MALSLHQKDTLTTHATQLARTRQALREYARYQRDRFNPPASQAELDWAVQVLDNGRAPQIAVEMQGELITDNKFANSTQPDASDIVDVEFKAAVEAIALKYT